MSEPDLTAASILFGSLIDAKRSDKGLDWEGTAAYGRSKESDEVQHWCAGWNLAGYSSDPDSVLHGVTIGEALGYLVEALEHEYDQFLPEEQAHAELVEGALLAVHDLGDDTSVIERDAEDRRADAGHWSVFAGPYVYWIMPCRTVGCDQVNTEYGDEEG
jgi:hypothetical protein